MSMNGKIFTNCSNSTMSLQTSPSSNYELPMYATSYAEGLKTEHTQRRHALGITTDMPSSHVSTIKPTASRTDASSEKIARRPLGSLPKSRRPDLASSPKHSAPTESGAANWSWSQRRQSMDPGMLIYNRVQKTGSTTVTKILKHVAKANNFAVLDSKVFDKISLDVESQRSLVEGILKARDVQTYSSETTTDGAEGTSAEKASSSAVAVSRSSSPVPIRPRSRRGFCFIRHVHFTHFQRFNATPPLYFNMARDPVEREISLFYYLRSRWRLNGFRRSLGERFKEPSADWYGDRLNPAISPILCDDIRHISSQMQNYSRLNMTLEKCLDTTDGFQCAAEEGHSMTGRIGLVSYFCGHEEFCMVPNSRHALAQALRNVEGHYPVVGILENFKDSLEVAERSPPLARFFRGARRAYAVLRHTDGSEDGRFFKNSEKPSVIRERVRQKLRELLRTDIELYEYLKQRLMRQYSDITRNDLELLPDIKSKRRLL